MQISFQHITLLVLGFAFCRALLDCTIASPPVLMNEKRDEKQYWGRFKQLQAQHSPPIQLAEQLTGLGVLAGKNGRYEAAEQLYREAINYASAANDRNVLRTVLILLAEAYRDSGHYGRAINLYNKILNVDTVENRSAADIVADTVNLGMTTYLRGCSAHSHTSRTCYFRQAEDWYKNAKTAANHIKSPHKDIEALVLNSYALLLIEENRLSDLRHFCDVNT